MNRKIINFSIAIALLLSIAHVSAQTLAIVAKVEKGVFDNAYKEVSGSVVGVYDNSTKKTYDTSLYSLVNGTYRKFFSDVWGKNKVGVYKPAVGHVTIGIIGNLSQDGTEVEDCKNKKFKVQDILKCVQASIRTYRYYQKANQYGGPVKVKLKKGAKFLYCNYGQKNVFVVQDVVSGLTKRKSEKFGYLVGLIRKDLESLGVTFKYGFKPHASIANISSTQSDVIDKLKALEGYENPNTNKPSALKQIFNKVSDSDTFKIKEIIMSKSIDMQNRAGIYDLALSSKRWATPYL